MATALTKFRPQSRPDGPPFSAYDAKAIATCGKSRSVITTPNMTFIPEPHVDTEDLRPRADGHFGTADCFQWPQDFAKDYEAAVCIPRREFHQAPDKFSWAWFTPTLEDLDKVPAEGEIAGTLKQEPCLGLLELHFIAQERHKTWKKSRENKKDILPRLLFVLRDSVLKIMNVPLPWRDVVALVAQAQRLFLDIIAFLDYYEIVHPRILYPEATFPSVRADWMGCFTKDAGVCSILFAAGVPVWYIRFEFSITPSTIIEKPVTYTFPDDIVRAEFSVPRTKAQPFATLYNGPGGKERHVKTRFFYESASSPAASTSNTSIPSHVGKAKTAGQSKKEARKQALEQSSTQRRPKLKGGRDKWAELQVPEMPLALPLWEEAMNRADKKSSRVKCRAEEPGYRVPEPALLISGGSPERRRLFMANWLGVRKFWLNRLEEEVVYHYPSSQQWRDFLIRSQPDPVEDEAEPSDKKNEAKTQAQVRQKELSNLFEDGVYMTLGSILGPKELVEWRDHTMSIASLANPPVHLVRAILWELFEIGFQYELHALDRVMVPELWVKAPEARRRLLECVWTGRRQEMKWKAPLPQERGDLGFTDAVQQNRSVFNSFCMLLSGWPGAHPSLYTFTTSGGNLTQQAAYEVLSRALLFYVQSFFDHFGRPPLVPHAFPLEYHQ